MNNLSRNNLLLLSASAVIILFLLGWVVYTHVYFANGQLTFGNIAARVGSTVVTEEDYQAFLPIYNGKKQCDSTSTVTSTREEVLNELVKVTDLKNKAADKGISVSSSEIEEEKINQAVNKGGIKILLEKCHWTDAQFTKAVEAELLKKKLGVS